MRAYNSDLLDRSDYGGFWQRTFALYGPSSLVNVVSTAGQSFRIEMQSGDVIEIDAASYTFSALQSE